MNFLAHLLITDDYHEEISVGNFMADAVKGKKAMEEYPLLLQKGIEIHRTIDDFTDNHELFKQGTKRLHENYGKYAPVIMDIFYDHILASNWQTYHKSDLKDFCDSKYELIGKYHHHLPEKARMIFRYMKRDNWLLSYQSIEGISSVLYRMDRRTNYISGMSDSTQELKNYYPNFSEEFYQIFNELKDFIDSTFAKRN